MERYADSLKKHVLNFKLEMCCFMATVRTGVMAFACINIAIGILTLMFFAEESFEPLLLKALNGISSEPPNYGPSCMIVYAVELGSNVVLLCAMIRNDLVLLRVYLYYAFGVQTAAVMVYSVMFRAQAPVVQCLIIASIGYQIYIILLVRSAMVEIKRASVKNGYTVNFRQSSVRYSRPGYKDKFSVVIEPQRRSLVPVVKETNSKLKLVKEVDKEESVKEAVVTNVTIHSPAKKGVVKKNILHEGVCKEIVPKEGVAKEIVAKEGVAKGMAKEATAKEAKEEVTKEVREGETVEPKRRFFGRKEKVKKDKNPAMKEVRK